jgi:hypothetical protein
MKGRNKAVTSTSTVGTVGQTCVSTNVDRIDRALGTTEQMERVGGSLPDFTVSDEDKIPGRGEDLFTLLLHFFEPKNENTSPIVYRFAGSSLGTTYSHYD